MEIRFTLTPDEALAAAALWPSDDLEASVVEVIRRNLLDGVVARYQRDRQAELDQQLRERWAALSPAQQREVEAFVTAQLQSAVVITDTIP